ncbi:STAS domain-containing protein [Streptomyces sp. NPDC001185]|uniref:STAS domain-containing protein n=1 Tax=Streptomyces sp. NPDC001185 TaxID=3154380 RepID=UPI0033304939
MQDTTEQPIPLSITQTAAGGIRVLVVSGEIDHDNADQLRQALRIDVGGEPRAVLDLGGVTFMDSSAINVLVVAFNTAEAAGGWIRLAALTQPVQRVVEIVGLDTVLACYPTRDQALAD